jgi:hypothetical protein
MSKFNVNASAESGVIQVTLNGKIIISTGGSAEVDLEDGKTYVVQWFVTGSPMSHYTLEITSPPEAKISMTKVLKDGHDYGGFRFTA